MCQCEDAPLGLGARTAPPSRPRHHIEASCPALVKTLLSSISSLRPCPVLPPKNWCDIMDMAGMATRGEVEYHPGITYFTLLREGRRTDRRERGGGEMLVTGGEERRGEGELLMISGASARQLSSPARNKGRESWEWELQTLHWSPD